MNAIVDCNSFYCSCERLFRPDLRDKPVVVLSNNDGCIISRSDEARKLGVGMGIPYFQARQIIEKQGISVFSSNYHLYGDMSWRVMETLRSLCQHVEVYSIDEAFLDLSEVPLHQLPDHVREIKDKVEQWTGISVSIGVAATKTLAKLANRLAKKNKKASGCISILATEEERRIALQRTRVDELWGVGRSYALKLIDWGITSGWELSQMPEEWAHSNMGGVVGVRLIRELRGLPARVMEEELVNKKMIATTRMFGRPVSQLHELKEAVATYISRAAEKLRRQQSAARTISVFLVAKEQDHMVNFRRGATISSFVNLDAATPNTHELIKPALELVEQLYEKGKSYKKAGVMLSGLVPDASVQGNLFVPQAQNQRRFLMNTIDNINFSMRDDSVKFGSSGMNKDWKMRQELRSGRYSTRWEDLRTVK
ncbi:MAG: Y-family DNA polymerase [Bacteroidota bacterium]|nr:Y-family DNA polymerase [Bacteroidota bacterium]MDP4216273.1 Y-family DNA polymerase [Bacteroidota bacterium]MDP4244438.1 Y-family DNA polymerase [Bacteroidota bacterium]MDP4255636.1 Y-family DNA polymerase [Bacteroidota bacterium]MDP4260353.1 Y-family DNA polymerase [Bacteroidota bacterium]